MVKTTRAQREALLRVYQRGPIYPYMTEDEYRRGLTPVALTYKQFRRRLCTGYDCVMIQWAGMWLGIEPDGYTHS